MSTQHVDHTNGGEMKDGSAWHRHASQRFTHKGGEGARGI
jgi:hypothetical protein